MSKNFNLENAQRAATQLIESTTFEEQMWIFRQITYDQIKYFGEYNKGIVYDGEHSRDCIHQATNLQRQISTCTDLFTQAVSKCRVQNEDYLKQYDFAGPYLIIINNLKNKIKDYEQQIEDLYDTYTNNKE